MTNFAKLITVVAALGAFAPLAANAESGMYQPSPIITTTPAQNQTAFPAGRTAHAQQMQALAQARQAQATSRMAQRTGSAQSNG